MPDVKSIGEELSSRMLDAYRQADVDGINAVMTIILIPSHSAYDIRADNILLARELLQFHDMAAIPDILAPEEGTGIITLDITALGPIDTAVYDTSTSPLFRSAMMR